MLVRHPAVAGQFYPAQPEELDGQLGNLIDQTEKIPSKGKPAGRRGKPKILIVPHAGIVYSGKVAGWGFKQIGGLGYSKIILLGVSHRDFFQHAAVFSRGFWETPLGKVGIAEDLAKKLVDQNIVADQMPHLQEHSLELELIFLQKVLKNFKILPVLVSRPSDTVSENIAQKISEVLDAKTLLVISSDLSHYLPWEVANKIDQKTIATILSGQKNTFAKNPNTCACGYEAIKIGLGVAEILGITNFKKINYANSGDITGEKSQVVGYTAIVAYA